MLVSVCSLKVGLKNTISPLQFSNRTSSYCTGIASASFFPLCWGRSTRSSCRVSSVRWSPLPGLPSPGRPAASRSPPAKIAPGSSVKTRSSSPGNSSGLPLFLCSSSSFHPLLRLVPSKVFFIIQDMPTENTEHLRACPFLHAFHKVA